MEDYWFEVYQKVDQTRKSVQFEKNRRGRWYIVQIDRTEKGHFVVTFRDITESKLVENELRESEERYRAFFESSIDAILLTAPDGTIYAANPEACRIFGMTEEEIIQAGRNGVVDTSDSRLQPALEERSRTGKFKGELNFR